MDLILENVSALAAKLGTQPEVITKFLTDAAAAEEVKPFAASLGGLQVFSATDFETRLANEKKLASDVAKGTSFDLLDKRIKQETGIDKLPEEARDTAAYAARAFREKFSKTTDSDELTRLQSDLEATKQALTTKNTEFNTYKNTIEKQTAKQQLDSAFSQAVTKVPLADPTQAEFLQFKFEQKYTPQLNGSVVEYKDKATGEIVRDTTTASPMTAEALLQQFAPTVQGLSLKKTSASEPSGFKVGQPTITEGATTMDYAALTSYDDFKATLAKSGIPAGSDAAGKLYAGLKEKRPDLIPK